MNIDPLQILQVTLYSKITNEYIGTALNSTSGIIISVLLLVGYKIMTNEHIEEIYTSWLQFFTRENDSAMTIPQHKRTYKTWIMGTSRESCQMIYSPRFRALNYYITTRMISDSSLSINSMIEVIKKEYDHYKDSETIDFLLLPIQKDKILLCPKRNIYFEIIVDKDNNEDEKDKKKVIRETIYTYKISIPDKNKYNVLEEFMNRCVEIYEKEYVNKDSTQQYIYEYVSTETDEDDRRSKKFLKYPFRSNKYLDKNIFFDGKDRLIEYIDRFIKTGVGKNRFEQEYEDSGVTFKAGILMHGPPGCGKSCSIRGILNRTGRHGILIPWSKMKSCGELCSLIRNPIINNKELSLKEVCFIIEDFDANQNSVLKTRSETKKTEKASPSPSICETDLMETNSPEDLNKTELIVELNKTRKLLELAMTSNKSDDDELTLECVLNLLDGIVELHDAMFIFTTNHLENIDPAFLRPGRIDYILEFKKASAKTIREMVEYRFRSYNIDFSIYNDTFSNMKDYVLSPAEVQNICFKYSYENVGECLTEIIRRCE
jgi:hypothetical protein